MRRYRVLRTWSVVLMVLGAAGFVAATLGAVWWAASVHGVWRTAAVIAIGAPIAALLGIVPLALGQGLRVLADIGDDVAFESLATAAGSPY